MVVIRLYGVLAAVAQRTVRIRAKSFDDAMSGLVANFPKIRGTLNKLRVSVMIDGKAMCLEDCLRPLKAERIDIMPIVGGNGPAILIVAGAALTAGAEVIAGWFAGTFLASAITAASIAQFGVAMVLGGISQLLFKPPKPTIGSTANDASYNFDGATNNGSQGGIVPVGYGRLRVGATAISANVQTWDIPVGQDASGAPLPAPAPPVPTTPDGPFQSDFGASGGP